MDKLRHQKAQAGQMQSWRLKEQQTLNRRRSSRSSQRTRSDGARRKLSKQQIAYVTKNERRSRRQQERRLKRKRDSGRRKWRLRQRPSRRPSRRSRQQTPSEEKN